MAGTVNKVILIGNLGRDPDIRSTQSGARVANLSVATSEQWKDRNTGERRERTHWHRVVVWNDGLVTIAERYVQKGSKVYVEGQLETRKWQDQSGQDRYTTEVVLRPYKSELHVLAGGRQAGNQAPSAGQPSGAAPAPAQNPPGDDFDDDIPF